MMFAHYAQSIKLNVPKIPVFVTVLFFFFPLITVPLILYLYLKYEKYRTYFSSLLGIAVGFIAYHMVPPVSFDLYRIQDEIIRAKGLPTDGAVILLQNSAEPVRDAIIYLVAQLGNPDLLQFFIVAIGYWIIFYIVGDSSARAHLSWKMTMLVLLTVLLSLTAVSFFSGLWNYFAMILFSLGFYLQIMRNYKAPIPIILYVLAIFVHTSVLFPVILLAVFLLLKRKISITLFVIMIAAFSLPSIISVLTSLAPDLPLVSQLDAMFKSYFGSKSSLDIEYGPRVIMLELFKLVPIILISTMFKFKISEEKDTQKFSFLLMFAIFAIIISSILFLRYTFLVVLLFTPLFVRFFKENKSSTKLGIVLTTLLILFPLLLNYQILMASKATYGELVPGHLAAGLYSIIWK